MRKRYEKVKEIVLKYKGNSKLTPLPFNSGYFMTFKTPKGYNEKLRLALLEKGIGTISLGETSFRIAYSSVDTSNMEDLYKAIFSVSDNLQ